MNQDTKPAPFNVGDHVRYIAAQKHDVPTGQGNQMDQVLTAGMEGVILISTGSLSDQGAAAPSPWRCQVQFANGFQLDITPDNVSAFEVVGGVAAPTV
jgi:hypothetical protein